MKKKISYSWLFCPSHPFSSHRHYQKTQISNNDADNVLDEFDINEDDFPEFLDPNALDEYDDTDEESEGETPEIDDWQSREIDD